MAEHKKSFAAVIREGRGGGAFVDVPFDVKATFGSARPKVLVTFDGEPYRGTIASMGGTSLIGILKEIRTRLGKDIGDTVRVTVEPDSAPREIAVPEDVLAALRQAKLEAAFDRLSYTHRREHINAIADAKRAETRQRRIDSMIDMLRSSD
jgi:4-hydroxy-3-methylbut-2-en-1-yl diphosphate synthase IspG/GcpE